MFFYNAYGFRIYSELALPELMSAELGIVDAVVKLGKMEEIKDWFLMVSAERRIFSANPEEVMLIRENLGVLRVRGGCEIVIYPVPNANDQLLRLFVLGSGMAILLYQRGLLTLHASAISVNGTAISFLGKSKAGKSTLIAALYARGHHLIADDLLAIDTNSSYPTLLPGYPQIKLFPDVAAFIGINSKHLTQYYSSKGKCVLRVSHGFLQETIPLSRIYLLSSAPNQGIEILSISDSFLELMRHSTTLCLLEATGGTPSHLKQCAKLLNNVTMYRLSRRHQLSTLPDLVKLIEENIL